MKCLLTPRRFDNWSGAWKHDSRPIEMPPLADGQVRIAMRACSLNYHDILTRRGMPGVRLPGETPSKEDR